MIEASSMDSMITRPTLHNLAEKMKNAVKQTKHNSEKFEDISEEMKYYNFETILKNPGLR
jgi:hypothetical protein